MKDDQKNVRQREYRNRADVNDLIRRYQRNYYADHPELQLAARKRAKEWYQLHKESVLERRRAIHPEETNTNEAARKERWKSAAIARFGGKCRRCGISDVRVLQFDHIHGGGNEARRNQKHGSATVTYYRMIALVPDAEAVFQLLCANCHCIKGHEAKEQSLRYSRKNK